MKHHLKLRDWVNVDTINWDCLAVNPNAIDLLEKNMDKIHWGLLSRNPKALHLLERNVDKIDWGNLSKNPNAIPLLKQNMDKIHWQALSQNPNLFELDYLAMSKERTKIIEKELMIKALHPSRISNYLDYYIANGGDICEFEY